MVNLSKVSESLKELMAERGINQKQLSEQLHTGRTKLSDILNGKNAPNYDTFIKLIEHFNCSADFLLGLSDYPREDVAYKPVRPFGQRVREIIAQSQSSLYALHKQAHISWSVIYGWLNGKSQPSCDTIVKLAAYFGYSVDYLLGRVD